jgi:hypothetical protein
MSLINRDWHAANRMPSHPSRQQRAKWHFEHAQACGCRAPSAAEQQLIAEHRALIEGGAVLGSAPEAVQ